MKYLNNFKAFNESFDFYQSIPESELISASKKFDALISGKKMFHGTPSRNMPSIRKEGLITGYLYFNVDVYDTDIHDFQNQAVEGSEYDEELDIDPWNSVYVLTDPYIDKIIPDPEGLPEHTKGPFSRYLGINWTDNPHDYRKEWLKWLWIQIIEEENPEEDLKRFGISVYIPGPIKPKDINFLNKL